MPGDVADVAERTSCSQQRGDQRRRTSPTAPAAPRRSVDAARPARSRSPSGSRPASRRASEAPLACRPLEATSTISSPGASSLAEDRRSGPPGSAPTAAPASSISSSASMPGSDGDSPPPHTQPASAQALRQPSSSALGALGLAVPLRGAGREVRVDDERQRADAAEVVEDRGDGVIGDVGEAVDALALRAPGAR